MRHRPRRTAVRSPGFATKALIVGAAVVTAPLAAAQELRVITASSANNQLSLINFDGEPSVTPLNIDANERKSLRGLAIRNDLAGGVNLIAADAQAGDICWYADPVVHPQTAGRCQLIDTTSPPPGPLLPSALALNVDGDLFALSSGTGNASSKTAEIWAYERVPGCVGPACRPGNYVDPRLLVRNPAIEIGLATPVTLELLEEARVYNGGTTSRVQQGDLLVLSSKPAALFILRGRGADPFASPVPLPSPYTVPAADILIYPAEATGVDASRKFPSGAEPGGFAFAPGGRILITTSTGTILDYGLDGQRRSNGVGGFLDFAAGLGNGKFKIEVALQRGVPRAFVADRNGGELLRFDIDVDGFGMLTGSVAQGVQFPIAVAATNSNIVATTALLRDASPTQGILRTLFREVDVDGLTSGTAYLIGDPRDHASGPSSFVLSDVDASLPAITIPPFVRGLPLGGPGGSEGFVVVLQATTAGYDTALEIVLDPDSVLGWDVPCTLQMPPAYGDDVEERLRAFWGTIPEFGEPSILEGPTVINVTSGCGSGRGIVREASIFVAGRDTRTPATQTSDGLARLGELLSGPNAAQIERQTQSALAKSYDTAVRAFGKLDYVGTRDNLLALADVAATVIGAPGRIGPELESRSRAAAFAVCSIEQPPGSPVCSVP